MTVEEKSRLEQTFQHSMSVEEVDYDEERDKTKKQSVWTPVKLVTTAPTNATETVDSQKEKSTLEVWLCNIGLLAIQMQN